MRMWEINKSTCEDVVYNKSTFPKSCLSSCSTPGNIDSLKTSPLFLCSWVVPKIHTVGGSVTLMNSDNGRSCSEHCINWSKTGETIQGSLKNFWCKVSLQTSRSFWLQSRSAQQKETSKCLWWGNHLSCASVYNNFVDKICAICKVQLWHAQQGQLR